MAPKTLLEKLRAKQAAKENADAAKTKAAAEHKAALKQAKKEARAEWLRSIGGRSTIRRWKRANAFD